LGNKKRGGEVGKSVTGFGGGARKNQLRPKKINPSRGELGEKGGNPLSPEGEKCSSGKTNRNAGFFKTSRQTRKKKFGNEKEPPPA